MNFLLYFREDMFSEITISLVLFLVCKVYFARLRVFSREGQRLPSELLAREVKDHVADGVVAVISASLEGYPIHIAAENVLHEKCRDRALSERRIFLRPLVTEPRRAGVLTPNAKQEIVQVALIAHPRKGGIDGLDGGSVRSEKGVFHTAIIAFSLAALQGRNGFFSFFPRKKPFQNSRFR